MGLAARIALAIIILVVDFVSFLVPLGSMAIAWVILTRPRWALDLVDKVYADRDFGPDPRPNDAPPEPAADAPPAASKDDTPEKT